MRNNLLVVGGLALAGAAIALAAAPSRAPAIKAIWPKAWLGTMTVEVDGSNLGDATRVTIGGQAASFRVKGQRIIASVPTDFVSGHVEVVTPEGRVVSRGWVEGPAATGVELQ